MNRIMLIGKVHTDPENDMVSQNTIARCRFTLEVKRSGSANRQADIINVVAFEKNAEEATHMLKSGSMVGLEGRLEINSWTDSRGQRVKYAQVIVKEWDFLQKD